jgi:hypothetical protein
MIDPELKAELSALSAKIDAVNRSAEATRKWTKWTALITLALIILPLLVLPFVAGSLISDLSTGLSQ